MGKRGASGNEMVDLIERERKRAGVSVQWLAEASGFAYSTFRRRVAVAPENFTVRDIHRLADALEVPVEALLLVEDDAS